MSISWAWNKKATIIRHLLKISHLKTTNTNTSDATHMKYISLLYGALARSNPYHWVLEASIAAEHAKYLGFPKATKKSSFTWGAFLLQEDLYELDPIALNLLDNVHGMTNQIFLRGTINMTSKNINLYEDMDATPKCDDLVVHVEAYIINSIISTPIMSHTLHIPEALGNRCS